MKDITIKGSQIRRELLILLGCFIAAEGVNLYAIVRYSRPAKELFMMIGYVIVVTAIIYVVLLLVRIIVFLVWKLFHRH